MGKTFNIHCPFYHKPGSTPLFWTGSLLLLLMASILLTFYMPVWQTNDDPLFSMLINGYGVASEPSSAILNCNFIWADFVRGIPNFLDIQNYTWAQYMASLLSLLLIWRCVTEHAEYALIKFLCLTAMLFYVFLQPQYTVTAAFCAISGVLAFLLYMDKGGIIWLVLSLLACFVAFPIREVAFSAIVVCGLFLYPWKKILARRCLWIILPCFFLLLAACYLLDASHKSGGEWEAIKAWQHDRQAIADADMARVYLAQPELLRKHDLSPNDMQLLRWHFSLDAGLRDHARLASLDRESDRDLFFEVRFDKAEEALDFLFDWPIRLLVFTLALLWIGHCAPRSTLSILLLVSIFFMIGFFNRGGVFVHRMYYPPLFFMILLFLGLPRGRTFEKLIYINPLLSKTLCCLMMGACILAFSKENLVTRWKMSQYDLVQSGRELDKSIWFGWPFMMEWIYSPFVSVAGYKDIRFQTAGWSALLDNAQRNFDVFDPNAFGQYFQKGFRLAGDKYHLELLRIYCREHFAGEMSAIPVNAEGSMPIYEIQCVAKPVSK